MRRLIYIVILFTSFFALGCSESNSDMQGQAEHFKMSGIAAEQAPTQSRNNYLAYEHSLTVELPQEDMKAAFNQLLVLCQQDANQCTVLRSELNSGKYARSYLRFRVLPSKVDGITALASSLGKLTRESTDVDDLQDAIVDGGKRIELLQAYQQRLLKLEQEANQDIESLIKVASELSRVQSDLEYALGEKARLLQRVNQDIVNVNLEPLSYKGFWAPIGEATGDFGEHLSDALVVFITALAYIIPWLLLLIAIIFVIRHFWRRSAKK